MYAHGSLVHGLLRKLKMAELLTLKFVLDGEIGLLLLLEDCELTKAFILVFLAHGVSNTLCYCLYHCGLV